MTRFPRAAALCLLFACLAAEADSGRVDWPRDVGLDGATVSFSHPRVRDWQDFRTILGSARVSIAPANGTTTLHGSFEFSTQTVVDLENRRVRMERAKVSGLQLEGRAASPEENRRVEQAAGRALGTVSLDDLLRALPEDFTIPEEARPPLQLNFDPPRIVVVERPTMLMLIDGPPARVPIENTGLEFVVNTDWKVFHDQASRQWFILRDGHWLRNNMLAGGSWFDTAELPQDFLTLQYHSDWPEVAAAMPPRKSPEPALPLVISYEPAELVETDGPMDFAPVGDGELEYVSNTESELFRLDDRYYLLVSGRWFTTKNPGKSWYSVRNLPEEFAAIPADHARGHVRASVPGTRESRLAQIESAIPRTAVVSLDAGNGIHVPYVGEPSFVEIQGTGLRRAENTPFQVIMHNNFYYLCHDGAWYSSTNPVGPWRTAREVPEAIYTIPPTDPAFNVTFVKLDSFDDSSGQAAYKATSGYYSRYWTGASMVYGTGWYYPGYHHRSVYWRYPPTYGYGYGAWGPYYPYYYNYSATIDIPPEKDWQWHLDGSKRAVYDYGPRNYIGGGTYVMPESHNHKAGGRQ